MKNIKKRDVLETISLLIEGNDFVAAQCSRAKVTENMPDILQQCQEMAIILGNCLESFGEEGEKLVPVLEAYCEEIYQISQNSQKEVNENVCKNIAKTTVEQLADLKRSIIEYIPDDKLEIVFLPYKASMWDSLESVWRAAADDPECDAYVVPIPYFEKNQQGELAVMHYEGNQFPDDVPVVHYMDYNLVERKPDVAFIHNPYDKYNYVTSIHPAYYVTELKKYVGKVAYIPYFVSPEPNPDSIEVQKQKKGFVIQPGVMDSDLVFVQSDAMKKLYVNILEKEIPNISREYWENKIFGLGSPKLDRVHNTKRNDDLLSSEWYSLIYDSKGNRKKVILYNTSLHDLLNQKNMMEKISDTLTFFKEREDCVLWWRPHPLYESTLASMIPGLLPVYRKIVEDYRAEKWGILDEGEDLDWAIAETDAYYGDGSSVVELYKEAGKPVLCQDTRVKNAVDEEVEIPIWPCAFCVDGDDIWFVHGKINIFGKYNKKSRKLEEIQTIPDERVFQDTLYQEIYKQGDKIYLIPAWAKEIAIYDIVKRKFSKIKLNKGEKYINKLKFGKCIVFEQVLYCIPCYYEAIVKIDLNTQEITYINLYNYTKKGISVYLGDGVLFERKIIGPWNLSNQLFVLDLKSEKIELISIGGKEKQYSKINKIGNNLVLYDENSKNVLSISIRKKAINNKINVKFEYSKLSTLAGNILVMDACATEQVVCLDENGKVKYESIGKPRNKGVFENSYCFGITSIKGTEYAYFDTTNYLLYIMDGININEQFDWKFLKIGVNQIKELLGEKLENIENENDILNLKELVCKNLFGTGIVKKEINSGEMIKNHIKQDL